MVSIKLSFAVLIAILGCSLATSGYFGRPCYPKSISYGSVSPKVVSRGNKAYYKCNTGYKLWGASQRLCTFFGLTGSPPRCIPVPSCPVPSQPAYGKVGPVQRTYPHGSKIWFSCNAGYELSNKKYKDLQCIKKGGRLAWNGPFPTCIPKTCVKPQIENGKFKTSNQKFVIGTNVRFACNAGFKLNGKQDIQCELDDNKAEWSDEFPTCEEIECAQVVVPSNGYINGKKDGNNPGDKVWFFCNARYELVGKKDLVCKPNGEWSADFPTCRPKTCVEPQIENGKFKTSNKKFVIGTKVWFSCNAGFKLNGKKDIQCELDDNKAEWSDEFPTCEGVKCPRAPRISYGSVKQKNNKAWYSCNRGYFLVGKKDIECKNGKWPKAPVCLRDGTCKARCGKYYANAKCQCNSRCYSKRDCCKDYYHYCY